MLPKQRPESQDWPTFTTVPKVLLVEEVASSARVRSEEDAKVR